MADPTPPTPTPTPSPPTASPTTTPKTCHWALVLGVAVLLATVGTVYISCTQQFAGGGNGWWLAGAILLSAIMPLILLPLLSRGSGVAVANTLWSSLSIVAVVLVGLLVFQERINAWVWAGVAVALVAVACTAVGTMQAPSAST